MIDPGTILSDDDVDIEEIAEDEREVLQVTKKLKNKQEKRPAQAAAFHFNYEDGDLLFGKSTTSIDNEDRSSDDDDENDDYLKEMPRTVERAQRAKDKLSKSTKSAEDAAKLQDEMDEKTEREYFDEVLSGPAETTLFSQLNLSRTLLRAVEAAGYTAPTPVQARVIPLALAGRDICASAVTGSGKTAAFILPVIERLLFRPRDVSAIRVLVVSPTRELASQTFDVLQKLAVYTDISSALICGGKKDLKSQEAMLRQLPDVVIGTPGRILDHLRNSLGVSIDELDVLILDEVDRLLELGFQEEVEELVRYLPAQRQTLLFSATMTPRVEDLARLSLRRPVRVKTASAALTVAPRLIQEFVKVKQPSDREALLTALVTRTFSTRSIVFFETKKETHRFFVLLTLLGVQAAELHGDMTQTLRAASLEDFKAGRAAVLVCTDVAARGIDIPGIRAVINSEMPRTAATYVHRVGRTARAGCGGRSVTLVTDARRKIMKEILKGEGASLAVDGGGQVLSRTVPSEVLVDFTSRIAALEGQIEAKIANEKYERRLDELQAETEKAENLLKYREELKGRPARTWHMSAADKVEVDKASRAQAEEEKKVAELGREAIQRLAALKDDYRADKEISSRKSTHRLSRVKRRRLEALKGSEDGDETSQRLVAKRAKSASRESDQSKQHRSPADLSSKRSSRPKIAVGGLSADDLGLVDKTRPGKKQRIQMAREKAELSARGSEDRTEKTKRTRVSKSTNSFKTKKRFKRR